MGDGREDFLSAITSYQLWFNIARKSISKDNKTPWEIIHKRDAKISPKICLLKPLFLNSHDGFNYKPLIPQGRCHFIPYSFIFLFNH
ncbi:MAG: hypothetical protein Kow0090_03760 [Myxococcota bacterium]